MDASENRQIARDSLFVMADMQIAGVDGEFRIKVRNLSARGMMGEGPVRVSSGLAVRVNIRNIGWIEGTVAWVQENRFGVAFPLEIDPKAARSPVTTRKQAKRSTGRPLKMSVAGAVLPKI